MIHRSDNCEGTITVSGSSSCSEFFKVEEKCKNACQGQCELINNRNYAILKKICTKIFKEYNRSKCREKYTVFEGGNSVNIRIHRSGSHGDGISPVNESCQNRKDLKYDKSNRGDNRDVRDEDIDINDKRITKRKGKKGYNGFPDNVCKGKTDKDRERQSQFCKREILDNCQTKRASRKSNKERKSKGNKDNLAKDDKNANKQKSNGYGDSGKYIINDLRKKVRRGEKVGLENVSNFMKKKKEKEKTKPSRADEVKACDFLRAQMEERDLCKLCSCPPSYQRCSVICYPKLCVPNIDCFPKICK